MNLFITSFCRIHEKKIMLNDRLIFYQENFNTFADFIKPAFKQEQITYPKFYKMDNLCKLGFLASDLVFRERPVTGYKNEAVGVVLANSSSSLDTDILHNNTISDRRNYFPSPSVFVYTLPNIVNGEICIRNNIKGENTFLVAESFNPGLLKGYVTELFTRKRVEACLCGWIEILGSKFSTLMMLVEKKENMVTGDLKCEPRPFDNESIKLLIESN